MKLITFYNKVDMMFYASSCITRTKFLLVLIVLMGFINDFVTQRNVNVNFNEVPKTGCLGAKQVYIERKHVWDYVIDNIIINLGKDSDSYSENDR